jgi:phosphohistidine swiveling domain-containing protein
VSDVRWIEDHPYESRHRESRVASRELGTRCVVSATGATRHISDGAIIEVNGDAGTVTVISLP